METFVARDDTSGARWGGGHGRARIGLVAVRFRLFDAQLGSDRVARIQTHADRSAQILERGFDVLRMPLVETEIDAAAVASRLASERLDAVVLAPTMAAWSG